jgi:hypothetical protein
MTTETSTAPTKFDNEHLKLALERIARAEIHRQPFPHIIVKGLFPDSFYKSLLKNFPDQGQFEKVEYAGTGHSRTAPTYHDYGLACRNLSSQPVFSEVHALFKSEAFSRTLLEKFGRQMDDGFWPIPFEKHRHFENGSQDFTSVFDLQIDLPGYAIPPHPDVPSKLVTFQFFLPEDDLLGDYGTLFCKPKNGRPTAQRSWVARMVGSLVTGAAEAFGLAQTRQYKWLERTALGLSLGVGNNRSWLPWNLFDIVKIAPALPNYFMAFPPNAVSYHAVRFDIPEGSPKQERAVIRGFIREGANTKNWITRKGM